MADQKKNKEEVNTQLTGFRRAVPIILVALAVFTGLCFIMQNTGTLGQAISRLLLGLFSIGGYFIPFFLLVHAAFFASDVRKKRLLGRIIFSLLTVFMISALTHTITFYSAAEKVFAPAQFYSDGINLHGGGFVGGVLSHGITYLFGPIGLIIISLVMFALYVTYFLSSGKSAFPRLCAKIGGAFSKDKKEEKRKKRADKLEERRVEDLRADQDELSNDEFFGIEGGMKEISIPALDIRQVRSDKDLETDPHLQEKVFPRSEVSKEGQSRRFNYGETYAASSDARERQRRVNMEYSTTDAEHGLSVSVKDAIYKERDDDIIIEAASVNENGGKSKDGAPEETKKEKSADELFANGGFEAYDFKISEELSNRPSSKAIKNDTDPRGIKHYEKSISDITPEEVEKARQRADWEMRKKANIEAQKRYAEAQAELAKNKAREANEAERVKVQESSIVFTYGTPDPDTNVYVTDTVKTSSPETEAAPTREAYIPDYMREEEAISVTDTAEAVNTEAETEAEASSTVGVEKSAAQNDASKEQYRRAARFANAISDYEKEKHGTEFKPYTAPAVTADAREEEKTILVSRSMLDPTAAPIVTDTHSVDAAKEESEKEESAKEESAYAANGASEKTAYDPTSSAYISKPDYTKPVYTSVGSTDTGAAAVREHVYTAIPEAADTRSAAASAPETSISEPYFESDDTYTKTEKSDVTNLDFSTDSESEDGKADGVNLDFSADVGYEDEKSDAANLDFSTDGEDEEVIVTAPPEEETSGGYEEVPPELQNKDVIEQRKMFSFLADEANADEGDGDEAEFPERPAPFAVSDEEKREDGAAATDAEAEVSSDCVEESGEKEDAPTPQRSAFAERMLAMERQKSVPDDDPEDDIEDEPEPEKPDYSDYVFPSIDLLNKGKFEEDINQEEEKNANAEKLVDALLQFNVRISIKAIDRGPRITRYEIVPARGVKVNAVTSLFNDIQLNLGVEGMRMEAPIPGKSAIGVEIPNKKSSNVLLRDLVESEEFISAPSKTMSCLGKDVTGNPVFADIAKMPHILVAGATGMGKSVCINAVLLSILYKARPDEVKLIMIDPKKVEFARYNGIPHLLIPVVTDVKQAAGALMWAVEQMEKRYDLLQKLEVSKLDSYNEKVRQNPSLGDPLPKIIIVIDELNDIMLQVRKPAEELIMSIAQKARAAGIHLIIGTQRPSVDVITGVIKANIPSRISCKVASYNDSKTILEQAGAEKLLNNGDMLYIPAGAPKALRVQGAFVSDDEVSAVTKHIKSQVKGALYDERALEEINKAAQKCQKGKGGGDDTVDDDDDCEDGIGILNDQQFLDAVDVALRSRKIATSLLQRKLRIGYAKAASFIDYMQEFGIVSEPNGSKPREVLITKDEWHEMLARRSLD